MTRVQNAVTWFISRAPRLAALIVPRSARLTALVVWAVIKAEGITLAEFMAGYDEYKQEHDKTRGVSED